MRESHRALSRALSFCCGATCFDVEQFFHRATWELHHTLESEVAAMAFVIKRGDGSCFVGRSREHQALPVETLLGMLVEKHGERLSYRVRDHALDTVRFLDHRFRTSVIVRVEISDSIARGCESALWFGLPGGAHPRFVTTAEAMGHEVSEWLSWYGGIIEANTRVAEETARLTRRIEEMQSLIHDARAPLGVLRYMTRDIEGGGHVTDIRQELDYLGNILSQGSPHVTKGASADSCEVGEVLRRVYRRYAAESGQGALTLEVGYQSLYGRCSSLELERIVTNLVSNAQRHAPQAQTRISAEDRAEGIIISVRDNGPGIPSATLDALRAGSEVESGCGSGWGIGLQSCISKAKTIGCELTISSRRGEGTCVSIAIPRGEPPRSERPLEVADGGSQGGAIDVCIVDDDREHGASLARVLSRFGISARHSGSLEEFLREFRSEKVSSILCDVHMPDGGAERLLPLVATGSNPPRFGVISGDSSDDYLYRVAALGAQAFFTKPIEVDEVVAWVRGGG